MRASCQPRRARAATTTSSLRLLPSRARAYPSACVMPSRIVVQSLHLLKPLRSPARWSRAHMLPLAMPLAFAAACSAHPVDKAQGTKPTAQAASSLCHPFGTPRPDKHVGRALDRTWFRSRVPNCHHSLLPPCAYSTSVMPNHSRLNSSPRPTIGTVPPSISSSIRCARDDLGRPTSFFRQILSLLRLTTSLHLPPCLMSTRPSVIEISTGIVHHSPPLLRGSVARVDGPPQCVPFP
jgi:hypothetical protein